MKITYKENAVIVNGLENFDIEQSCECGQCFRWKKNGEGYDVVAKGRYVAVKQPEKNVLVFENTDKDGFESVWREYFDIDRDYREIKKNFENDEVLNTALKFGWGIRVFRQDIWETLISFIISQNNNIPRIKGIIERLCVHFGEKIETKDGIFYKFPNPEDLAGKGEEDLAVIRAGFRTKYILSAVEKVLSKEVNLNEIEKMPYEEAKKELIKIKGVGNKVADCVLLFGAGKLSAFPVDVWVKRMLHNFYGADYDIKNFGDYAGVAQQYLFYYGREKKIRN